MIKFLVQVLKSINGWAPPDPSKKPPLGMEATDLDLIKKTQDENTRWEGINDSHRRGI